MLQFLDRLHGKGAYRATTAHSLAAKSFHWGFIVLFVFALSKQIDELEELEDTALLQFEMVFASVFLAAVVVRFLFMRFTRPTVLPSSAPPNVRRLAALGHLGMYAGITGIAVSGLAIGTLYGAGTKGGFAMEAFLLMHEICVNGTYTLIALHVFAALYHRRLRDGVWNAMVPFWKERPSE